MASRECRYCARRAAPAGGWEWCDLGLSVAALTKPARTAAVKAHLQAMEIVASADSLGRQYPDDLRRDRRLLWGGPDHLLRWVPVRLEARRCRWPGCPRLTVLPQPRTDPERCWHHQPAEFVAEMTDVSTQE